MKTGLIKRGIALGLLLALAVALRSQAKQEIILGVVEEFHAGEVAERALRVMFHKDSNEWRAFPSKCSREDCLKTISKAYPSIVAWTIAFDGKDIGKISGHTQTVFQSYSEIGRQDIVEGKAPLIGKKSGAYGGVWDTDVYRPLVVVSKPFFKDPESWKPASLDAALLNALRAEFKKRNPKLCRLDNATDNLKNPWKYPDAQIRIVRSYSSSRGWSVVGLRLDGVRDCADEEAGFQIDDPWFVISPGKNIKFLDEGVMLVDAGDYDDDGRSELLFVINRSHDGGFELFYDDFKKKAVFDLGSH